MCININYILISLILLLYCYNNILQFNVSYHIYTIKLYVNNSYIILLIYYMNVIFIIFTFITKY